MGGQGRGGAHTVFGEGSRGRDGTAGEEGRDVEGRVAAAGWRYGDHIYRQVPGSGGAAGGGAGWPPGSGGRLSAGGPSPVPAPAAPRGASSRGARLRRGPGAPAGSVRALLGAVRGGETEPRVRRRGGGRSGASTGAAPLLGGRSSAPSGGRRHGGVGAAALQSRSQRAAPPSGYPGAPLRGLLPGSCCNSRGCGQRQRCELGQEGRGGQVSGVLGHGARAAGRGLPARFPPAAGHAPGSRSASARGGLGAPIHRRHSACLATGKKGREKKKERRRKKKSHQNPQKIERPGNENPALNSELWEARSEYPNFSAGRGRECSGSAASPAAGRRRSRRKGRGQSAGSAVPAGPRGAGGRCCPGSRGTSTAEPPPPSEWSCGRAAREEAEPGAVS